MTTNYDSWESLYGKELEKVEKIVECGEETVVLTFTDGTRLKLYHEQECCEQVFITGYVFSTPEVDGFASYYGRPLLSITKTTIDGLVPWSDIGESATKTIFTFKWGSYSVCEFEVHWLGTSNGYYYEGVSYSIHREECKKLEEEEIEQVERVEQAAGYERGFNGVTILPL
jgi:hypothetical protein